MSRSKGSMLRSEVIGKGRYVVLHGCAERCGCPFDHADEFPSSGLVDVEVVGRFHTEAEAIAEARRINDVTLKCHIDESWAMVAVDFGEGQEQEEEEVEVEHVDQEVVDHADQEEAAVV